MSAFSDYLEEAVLNFIFNNNSDSLTPPVTYLAAFTVGPSDDGSGTEVSGGSYARVVVNPSSGASPKWAAAAPSGSGHAVTNAADVSFPTATASWGTIVGIGIFDASSGGNLLAHGQLGTAKAIGIGDTLIIRAGDGTFTLA